MIRSTSGHLRDNLERLMEVIKAKEAGKEEKSKISLPALLDEIQSNIFLMIKEAEGKIEMDLKET